MITLDSPVATLLGDQKKKRDGIVERLGLRSVGDLLHHFPRRYLKTGELTRLGQLQDGELLTFSGRLGKPRKNTYTDRRTGRPAYRVDTVVHADGAVLRMSFFAQSDRIAEWNLNRLAEGRQGIFLGKVGSFRGDWQLTNPQMVLFGSGGEDLAELSLEKLRAYYPIYPLTKGVDSWDIQKAIAFALTVVDEVPDLLP